MKIERTLALEGNEFDIIDRAFNIINGILGHLDIDEELVADTTWSYDDIKQVLYFLNELNACIVTIEKRGE